MEPRYTVSLLASVECEYRHRELALTWILATHIHEICPVDTELTSEVVHVLAEETLFEVVVTSWNWSVTSIK